jgi:hypothetical protein
MSIVQYFLANLDLRTFVTSNSFTNTFCLESFVAEFLHLMNLVKKAHDIQVISTIVSAERPL